MTKTEITKIIIQQAERSAKETISNARSVLRKALEELDRYALRFEEAKTPADKAQVVNWTLHYLTTYIPGNARFDLMARAQAELACAQRAIEEGQS